MQIYKIKIYQKSHLLSIEETIHSRINSIVSLSKQLAHIPQVSFRILGDKIEYRQEYVKREPLKHLSETVKIESLLSLGVSLFELEKAGFVHGDINFKNVIFSKDSLYLIDLEPDLLQVKNGRQQCICTMPYIAFDDMENKEITIKTDKLGWYFFVARFLFDKKISNPIEWMKKRIENINKNVINNDRIITDLSYSNIVNQFNVIDEIVSRELQITWRY